MTDNFAPLTSSAWQAHVYGEATADLHSACVEHNVPLHTFPWTAAAARAGLERNAVYLVRPDGYVALADRSGSASAVATYFRARALTPGQ